jgi:hypothetical protein
MRQLAKAEVATSEAAAKALSDFKGSSGGDEVWCCKMEPPGHEVLQKKHRCGADATMIASASLCPTCSLHER